MKRILLILASIFCVYVVYGQSLKDGPSSLEVCFSGDTIEVKKDNVTSIHVVRGDVRVSYIGDNEARRIDLDPTAFGFANAANLRQRLDVILNAEYDSTAYIYTTGGAVDTIKYIHGSTMLWGVDYTHNGTLDTITGQKIIIP